MCSRSRSLASLLFVLATSPAFAQTTWFVDINGTPRR